jgi:hypothetical protein
MPWMAMTRLASVMSFLFAFVLLLIAGFGWVDWYETVQLHHGFMDSYHNDGLQRIAEEPFRDQTLTMETVAGAVFLVLGFATRKRKSAKAVRHRYVAPTSTRRAASAKQPSSGGTPQPVQPSPRELS